MLSRWRPATPATGRAGNAALSHTANGIYGEMWAAALVAAGPAGDPPRRQPAPLATRRAGNRPRRQPAPLATRRAGNRPRRRPLSSGGYRQVGPRINLSGCQLPGQRQRTAICYDRDRLRSGHGPDIAPARRTACQWPPIAAVQPGPASKLGDRTGRSELC